MEIIFTYAYTLTDTHASVYEVTPAKQAPHDLAKALMLQGVSSDTHSYRTI